jgi:hypothetical protein
VATGDPSKIRFWAEHHHHRNFGLRIPRRSRLIVVDTEGPLKHPDQPGPDGEMTLWGLLEEHNITFPIGPIVRTPSGGFHRYMLVPKGSPVRTTVSLWPGIDILAAGSSVVLPGSHTAAGEYQLLRSFEDFPIPEVPRAFLRLMRKLQKPRRATVRPRGSDSRLLAELDTSVVSRRQWVLLFRNRTFRTFWKRQGKTRDPTDSAYEFHLAKACFCCGLNHRQVEAVIVHWRRKHGLTRKLRKLRQVIIPKAWQEVQPWVTAWQADRDAAKQARHATKTTNLIVAYMLEVGGPQMPAAIAAALPISRERAKKAMQRMASQGKLLRTPQGYQPVTALGTFQRITTPL